MHSSARPDRQRSTTGPAVPLVLVVLVVVLASATSGCGLADRQQAENTPYVVPTENGGPEGGWTGTGDQADEAQDRADDGVDDGDRADGETPVTVIHVAEGGTGDGLSIDSPLGSIDAGMELLGPGMTLVVAAGRYEEDIVVAASAGTPDQPVTVRAEGRVVVRGLVRINDADHWDISGLNVTWPPSGSGRDHLVKLTGGRGWVFRDAEIWGARSFAAVLVAGDAADYRLSGLYVHDTVPTNDVNQDHLIYINSRSGPGVVTRNLLVGSPNGRAVKVGGARPTDVVADVTIDRNTMIDNWGPSNVQVSGTTSNITISRNIMINPSMNRNAVTLFDHRGSNITAADNVVWLAEGVGDDGIVDGGGNQVIDPMLGPNYAPTVAEAGGAGHLAP